jgi:hypothetical protein
MKRKTSAIRLSKMLDIAPARGSEAVIKAQLISAVLKTAKKNHLTHLALAKL